MLVINKQTQFLRYVKTTALALLYISIPLSVSANSQENTKHNHTDIAQQAKAFIESELTINHDEMDKMKVAIKPLDNRLQLHQCTQPLHLFWPPGAHKSGHTSIGVRCNDHKPWKIFIGAQIQRFAKVWVAHMAISRGTVLTPDHVGLEQRDISRTITQHIPSTQSPIGLVTKRPLRAGDLIQSSALVKQKSVRRGDRVTLIARKNGLEIRALATALTDGATGDKIRVRNQSTKKELEGILRTGNIVHVNI